MKQQPHFINNNISTVKDPVSCHNTFFTSSIPYLYPIKEKQDERPDNNNHPPTLEVLLFKHTSLPTIPTTSRMAPPHMVRHALNTQHVEVCP
jgi:hypothetical protein